MLSSREDSASTQPNKKWENWFSCAIHIRLELFVYRSQDLSREEGSWGAREWLTPWTILFTDSHRDSKRSAEKCGGRRLRLRTAVEERESVVFRDYGNALYFIYVCTRNPAIAF